jgi:transposase
MALQQLRQSDPDIHQAYALTVEFEEVIRRREPDQLTLWLDRASGRGIPEIVEFARGLERDRPAIETALTLEWSRAQVEGQFTRLKLRKRESYGRASFSLLKRRVLYAV